MALLSDLALEESLPGVRDSRLYMTPRICSLWTAIWLMCPKLTDRSRPRGRVIPTSTWGPP